jgi:hypothetical protein
MFIRLNVIFVTIQKVINGADNKQMLVMYGKIGYYE